MSHTDINEVLNKFNEFTEKPVKFLTAQTEIKDGIKSLVKSVYDYTKAHESVNQKTTKSALPQLIIDDFDEEQIWQEIELQNSECWHQFVWEVANSISSKNDLIFPVTTAKEQYNVGNDSVNSQEKQEKHCEQELSDMETGNIEKHKKDKTSLAKSKFKPSIVDDKFFKLQEMEKFLINEEKSEQRQGSDSEGSIDMFEDFDDESADEEGGKEAMYNDFFSQDDENSQLNEQNVDQDIENDNNDEESYKELQLQQAKSNKNVKKVRFADESDSSDDNSDDSEASTLQPAKVQAEGKESEFERRQQRLKQQIEKLEENTLLEAPWQLRGEVDVTKRPQNSLLEEVVDFDLTSRPPPIITEKTTLTLEDIIKKRIKDKAWDDVEKKEKPVNDELAFRKTLILNQTKSKQSLAQIYEEEYLKQKQALSGEMEEEKEPESHTEIRDMMSKLFAKLDALSHYHYTPRPPQAEVKIVSNTPAISMEEVAPVATSDATLLAPEEVKRKRKGELISKEERTETDKKRARRKKKKLQKANGDVLKVTEHKNKQKAKDSDDKSLKTSKAFFQQLNDDSISIIKNRNVKNKGQ